MLNIFGNKKCEDNDDSNPKPKALFDIISDAKLGLSLSGESCTRAALFVLGNGNTHYRDDIEDMVFIWGYRVCDAVRLIRCKYPNDRIDIFHDVKHIMGYFVTPRGAFQSYNHDIDLIIIRRGRKVENREGFRDGQ